MSDYLSNLLNRSSNRAAVVLPPPTIRFQSVPTGNELTLGSTHPSEAVGETRPANREHSIGSPSIRPHNPPEVDLTTPVRTPTPPQGVSSPPESRELTPLLDRADQHDSPTPKRLPLINAPTPVLLPAPPSQTEPVKSGPATARPSQTQPVKSGPLTVRPHLRPPIEPGTSRSVNLSEPVPTIQVTIGSIEVRAVPQKTTPSIQVKPVKTGPALSLSDYLQQRRGGER